MDIVKRPAIQGDSDLILSWRNSASARNVSKTTNELNEGEHKKWFETRIRGLAFEPFWIMSTGGLDIGFVRLDFLDNKRDTFVVSIFVDPEFRKMGFAKQMLKLAFDSASADHKIYQFLAVIRRDNLDSIKLFESFGFELSLEINDQFNEYRVVFGQKDSSALSI